MEGITTEEIPAIRLCYLHGLNDSMTHAKDSSFHLIQHARMPYFFHGKEVCYVQVTLTGDVIMT